MNSDRIGLTKKVTVGICGDAKLVSQQILEKLSAKAGDEGKLFGSVGTRDIADALTNAGLVVDRAEVRLPNGALRHTGEFNIAIQLHHDVVAEVLVTIVSE